jgi:hypothetical protein
MIEFIPCEYAHRPVEANNYMFIHCLFVGYRKEYNGEVLSHHPISNTRFQNIMGKFSPEILQPETHP